MRVCLTSHVPLPLGGIEQTSRSGWYIEQVADSLHEMGHEVTVIAPAHGWVNEKPYPTRSIIFNPAATNPSPRPTNAHYTSYDFNFPVFSSHPLSTQTFFDLSPTQLDSYVMGQLWTLAMSALIFGAPDIVLNSYAWTWNYASSAFPTVFVPQGKDIAHAMDMGPLKGVNRTGLMRVAGAIAPTTLIARTLAESKLFPLEPHNIVVIPGGYRKEHFDVNVQSSRADLLGRYAEELSGITDDASWIVYSREAAHLEGVMNLITAAQRYEWVGTRQVATIIIGLDGIHLRQARSLADRLETKNVRFIEKVQDPADIARFFKEAQVIVFPSGVDPVGLLNGNTEFASMEAAAGDFMHLDHLRSVFGDIILEDQGSAASIRRAIEYVQRNTEMPAAEREQLTALLNYQLTIVDGKRTGGGTRPECDARCEDNARRYRAYAAREITIDSITDGVVAKLKAGEREDTTQAHNLSLKLLSRYYGWEVVGRRLEAFLNGVVRRHPKPTEAEALARDVDYAKYRPIGKRWERLRAIQPDLEVMEAFAHLLGRKGTSQFPRAMRVFDKTVMEWLGKRAHLEHPLDVEAMPDPSVTPFSIFFEVSHAAGITVEELAAVMAELPLLGAETLTGRSFAPPPQHNGTLITLGKGGPSDG